MTNIPSVPNYTKDVGRLVTDRYDFQSHINGANFRHQANQIDLSPLITIGGVTTTNVQDAIAELTTIVTPPIISDATVSSKGIIQLTGDIAGVATSIIVTRLQGKPISTLSPINGDVLTWDGVSSVWKPSAATNAFNASGDLVGNNVTQQVTGLTGSFGSTRISSDALTYISSATPSITQAPIFLNHGSNFTITAQSSGGISKNGGDLILVGGNKGSGGLRGGVQLQMGAGDTTMLQLSEIAANRRIMSLLHVNALTNVDMPANTGDMVMYVRDTITPPTTGNPLNGTIVYSSGGQLWIKQQDGNNFAIGSIPNPSIWGTTGQQTYTNRSYVTSSVGTAANAFTFALLDNTSTKIDVIFVGKSVGAADGAEFNLSMGYLRNGGSPIAVGTVTNADPRTTAGAATGWTIPSISLSGNNLQIFTGFSSTNTINWFVIVQLAMSQG